MDRSEVPRPSRWRVPWIVLTLFSLAGCGSDGAHPSEIPPSGTVSPTPVQIAILTTSNELLGPLPPKGSVRVRPKQDELYTLRAHSTSNYQIPAQTVRVFVSP